MPRPSVVGFLAILAALLVTVPAPSEAGRHRIMPLGDSITGGVGGYDSYRAPLWSMLEEAGYRVDFVGSLHGVSEGAPTASFDVDHEGHSGYRADEVLPLVAPALAEHEPDIVLLHIGTNDIAQYETPEQVLKDIETLVAEIQDARPGIVVLLATLIEADLSGGRFDRIPEVNLGIPTIVAGRHSPDSPVLLVDQAAAFDPAVHTFDRVHPNAEGEQVMAETWLPALTASIDAGGAVVTVEADPWTGAVGDPFRFRAEVFHPSPWRTVTELHWDLGEGIEVDGDEVEHVFPEAGIHVVACTALDDAGMASTREAEVRVLGPVAVRRSSWGQIKSRFGDGP